MISQTKSGAQKSSIFEFSEQCSFLNEIWPKAEEARFETLRLARLKKGSGGAQRGYTSIVTKLLTPHTHTKARHDFVQTIALADAKHEQFSQLMI